MHGYGYTTLPHATEKYLQGSIGPAINKGNFNLINKKYHLYLPGYGEFENL